MSEINLGRVQGGSFFFSTAEPSNKIQKNSLTPNNITPLIGDCVVFNKGGLYKIIEIVNEEITLETVGSIAGPQGDPGPKGDYKIIAELSSESALPASPNNFSDAYLIGGNIYVWVGSGWKNMGPVAQTSIIYGTSSGTAYEGNQGQQNRDNINNLSITINGMSDSITELNNYIFNEEYRATINNYYIAVSTGQPKYDSNTERTDYVYIKGQKTIKYYNNMYAPGYVLAFYDQNKQLLASESIVGIGLKKVEAEVVVPANAVYAICSNYSKNTAYIKTTGQLSGILDNYTNDINKLKDKDSVLEGQISDIVNTEGKAESKTGYIVYSDGHLRSDTAAYNSDFIEIGKNTSIIYLDAISSSGAAIAYYDQEKTYLKDVSIAGTNSKTEQTVKIPQAAKYFRYCIYGTSSEGGKYQLINKNNLESRVDTLETSNGFNFYKNAFGTIKKFGLVGDSISVGHSWNPFTETAEGRNIQFSWGQYLARDCGNICLNFGHTGVDCRKWLTGSPDCKPYLIDTKNKCQVYIVNLGANDADHIQSGSLTLGNMSDINFDNMELNAQTFYGYYAQVLNTIYETNPDAITIVLPVLPPRNTWNQVIPVNIAIREIASDSRFHNVHYIDLVDYNSMFNNSALYKAQYTHTHWTALGYKMIAQIMNKVFADYIKENPRLLDAIQFIPYGNNNIIN